MSEEVRGMLRRLKQRLCELYGEHLKGVYLFGSYQGVDQMAVLHLNEVPAALYERLQKLAAAHKRSLEAEALAVLQHAVEGQVASRSQAELLEDLKRRSFTPPAGTPDSVQWLREDRGR